MKPNNKHDGSNQNDPQQAAWRDDVPPADTQSRLSQQMREHWADLETQPVAQITSIISRITHSWRVAAALGLAAGLVVLMVALTVLSSPRSVYAKALAGLREAQTFHAVSRMYQDGGVIRSTEIWYDAQLGLREESSKGELTHARLDDGEYEWLYRAEANTVVKGLSHDTLGEVEPLINPLAKIERHKGQRKSTLDQPINGIPGQAWVMTVPASEQTMRYVVWLDQHNRMLRFESQLQQADQWVLDERADIRYDIPLPDDIFTPDFPAEARLVDRTKALQGFALEDALATAERLGIVLAIHDIWRIDDDTMIVTSSSRASQAVIDRFGPINSRQHGSKVYGQFTWAGNGRRLPDHSWLEGMETTNLTSWTMDGVEYQWVLLRRITPWLDDAGKLRVGFHLHTRNEWQEALKSEGKTWWFQNENDVLTLDLPESRYTLDEVLGEIHQLTLGLAAPDSARSTPWLNYGTRPYTTEEIDQAVAKGIPRAEAERLLHALASKPLDITPEDWTAKVRALLDKKDAEYTARQPSNK